MELESLKFLNRQERISTLKLIIKVAIADNKYTNEERATLQKFLDENQLKISKEFLINVKEENYSDIVSVFESKPNLDRAYSIVKQYASMHGIHPDHEGKVLDEIKSAIQSKKKTIKFNIIQSIKRLFITFSYLWGKEEISPEAKSILAIVFTIVACILGLIWTSSSVSVGLLKYAGFGFIERLFSKNELVHLTGSATIIGLLMYGALSFRNYLPLPNNYRNILFSIANLCLFSIIAMHIIGRSDFEKGITFAIFFGLILALWLGMKEIIGFIMVGFFILLIWKIIKIDQHLDWRAFPFIVCAFFGISFQSNNFFSDFSNFSGSFFKKPEMDKDLLKESLQLAGNRVAQVTKSAVSIGTAAAAGAAGVPPGATSIAKAKIVK
jgi:hypothetical protein